jgi:hypothetical protein
MYSRQMLCLITPDFAPGAKQRLDNDNLREKLNTVFKALKFVHFASIALLPGRPGGASPPSLMLELVIDDGVAPPQAIDSLAAADIEGTLRSLYFGDEPADAERLRKKLLPLLTGGHADGGFIGMRDRTATQVRAEARYFLAAREQMGALREQARAAGEEATPSLLVQRLLAALAGDPGQAAMQSRPPRSFWPRPRTFAWRLLLALTWVGLPVPLMVVALASVGFVFEAAVSPLLPATATYFVFVAAAAALLLFIIFLLIGLLRVANFSMSLLILILSACGVAAAYVWLVGNLLRVSGHASSFVGPAAAPQVAMVLATVVVAWALILRSDVVALRVWLFRIAAGLAAAVVVMVIGYVCQGWLCYFIPLVVLAVLLVRSTVVRWMLVLGWVLVPVLLLSVTAASLLFSVDAVDVPKAIWTPNELLAYFTLGALAHLALALLVGVLASGVALATVRRPWWPLGLPLLGLVVLLVALAAGTGAVGIWVYEALCGKMTSTPSAPWVYSLTFALALASAAAFVLAVRWLAVKALPAIIDWQRKLDRASADSDDLRPCIVPPSILSNEAALAGKPNHMISLTEIRGRTRGWRCHMLRLWLHIVGKSGHVWYTRGFLGDAWGIKFGHWHVIDDGRRLLFISNFDGPFGGYLDEFILGVSQGINMIWRWTELKARPAAADGQPEIKPGEERCYPPTKNWAFRGCHQEQHFKAYARASMVPHLYLFRAYDSSNSDIHRATQLRTALAGERSPANDDLVLRILES